MKCLKICKGMSSVWYWMNGCDSERRRRAAACRVRSPRGGGAVAPARYVYEPTLTLSDPARTRAPRPCLYPAQWKQNHDHLLSFFTQLTLVAHSRSSCMLICKEGVYNVAYCLTKHMECWGRFNVTLHQTVTNDSKVRLVTSSILHYTNTTIMDRKIIVEQFTIGFHVCRKWWYLKS